ncbi:hypothetical protein [Microbacterium sp. NPDC056052]|uniref:hypothetical protein n=1 Tax=Microbacterium sp. NPDC056052 TaxID=3345695 RepID=UPI0035D7C593
MEEPHATTPDAETASVPAPSSATSRPRRRTLAWLLPTAIAVLVLGALTGLELTAWKSFDDAGTTLSRTLDDQDDAARQVEAAITGARSVGDATTAVLAVSDGGLLAAADRTVLATAGEQNAKQIDTATTLIPGERPRVGARRFWFWDVNADTARLEDLAAGARARTKSLTAIEGPLRTATDALRTTASTALSAAADRATGTEAANVPADNDAVLEVRAAAAEVTQRASPFQPRVSADYGALAQAVQRLQDSHAATLAAESGPLAPSRLDLEAFARSLAPGILMDFEWADLINGMGESNGYLSGETSWWYDRGGHATIRLSNSIAQEWPDDSARAIVAHEVGHAITIRCRTMYDTSNDQTAEAWATAWAISMGFTDEANGTSAYGAPPDTLVQTAAGCR